MPNDGLSARFAGCENEIGIAGPTRAKRRTAIGTPLPENNGPRALGEIKSATRNVKESFPGLGHVFELLNQILVSYRWISKEAEPGVVDECFSFVRNGDGAQRIRE